MKLGNVEIRIITTRCKLTKDIGQNLGVDGWVELLGPGQDSATACLIGFEASHSGREVQTTIDGSFIDWKTLECRYEHV